MREKLRARGEKIALAMLACGVLAALGAAADEVAPSTQPPGGLEVAETPQIVLLTFDDSVTSSSYVRVMQALTNAFNPNGHPIKATFFVSMDSSYDPSAIRRLYDAGHEIAVHTLSHGTGTNSSLTRWRQEIAGCRRTLNRLSGIPEEEIVGFRAPFLLPNDATFRVLAERQFLYDASFQEELGWHSTASTNLLWPYTLDQGVAQNVPPGRAPATNYPGLFEIPLWVQFTNEVHCSTMDPPEWMSSNQVVELWRTNFLARYNGNRAPYGIFLHATSTNQWLGDSPLLAARTGALRDFIAWALSHPDTWFITCRDLAEFMLDPVAASEAHDHPSFQTPERTPFPDANVVRCSYPGTHTLSVCGECPPAAPAYTNAYLGLVPAPGGTASFNIVSQNASYAWCTMTVSNNVASRRYDWAVAFSVSGGLVGGLHDAVWSQDGEHVVAQAKQYNEQIAAGAARTLTFRITRTGGAVKFHDEEVALYALGQLPVYLKIERESDPAGWELSWNDDAHVYDVESSTNLLMPAAWSTVTNGLCQPRLVQPPASDGAPRFFRVKATVY